MLRSITVLKIFHAFLFIIINAALIILLYEVIADRITILSWLAVALFLAEGAVLLCNGWKCPLTQYIERLGAPHGQVTDLFLPKWLADRAFLLYGTLWGAASLFLVLRIVY